MRLILKHGTLISAALLTLLLAAAHYRGGLGSRPALFLPPPAPAVAALKIETKGALILASKMTAKPFKPLKRRGAALRDKGEALGGGASKQVDKSTETPAAL